MEPQSNSSNTGIKVVSIVDEIKTSYINYAMSVIVARALPDVRDGLKPVQRRIIYAMYKEGLTPGGKYSKCMGVVGEVLKKYHPHGDASVYDALVRLVQDWTMRYPLVDGQGNFGSIDGDGAAAPRYTECRMEKITPYVVKDIEKDTVNFTPNYTGEHKEPTILPAEIPTLIINGADGIAVGMATKIAPHNLGEIIDAIIHMIETGNTTQNEFKFSQYSAKDYYDAVDYDINTRGLDFPKFTSELTVSDLMKFVKGPDFPTGAEVYNIKEIRQAYETGRGWVLMRAIAHIEETSKGKVQIIVKELPYQVNKAKLSERIYELVKTEKLEGIADLRDESTHKEGIRLVVELKKGVIPNVVLNKLFKYTEMQTSFSFNMLALVDGEPKVLSLKEILEQFLRHRYEIIIRKSIYDLNENKKHIHILEGLLKALDIIDEIIALIRAAKNAEIAKEQLISRYEFTDVQAQAILDMQLRKLAALERQKLQDEYEEVLKRIKELTRLLDSQSEVEGVIKNDLIAVKEKFGDKRRTKVIKGNPGEFNEEDLIEKEQVVVAITRQGYIKRVKIGEFRSQSRGGKGAIGSTTKEGDNISHLIYCDTHSEVLLFTNKGKVYSLRAYEIPEYSRKAKGLPLVNLISIEQGEIITTVLSRNNDEKETAILDADETQEGELVTENLGKNYNYLFMATRKGTVKKVAKDEFTEIRRNGLIAINLDKGDELLFVRPTDGKSDVLIMTENARTVRFREEKVTATGRSSRGVRGIKIVGDDNVIMMDVVRNNEDRVLTVSERGFGKITVLTEFPPKGRGTKGMLGYKVNAKTGKLAVARIIDHPKKEVILISKKGQTIRTSLDAIRVSGRVTSGVILFRMPSDDRIATLTVF